MRFQIVFVLLMLLLRPDAVQSSPVHFLAQSILNVGKNYRMQFPVRTAFGKLVEIKWNSRQGIVDAELHWRR